MELEQLIPERATIVKTIEGEGETRELELNFRPFNLEDESWLKRAYGDDLKKHFEQMDMEVISRVAFHQLELDSKREVMKLKFYDMDEDSGEESEVSKTGPQKIRQIIAGPSAQMELLTALLKTRGFSMPILEELGVHLENEVEKKSPGKQKKARKMKSIGPRSLT